MNWRARTSALWSLLKLTTNSGLKTPGANIDTLSRSGYMRSGDESDDRRGTRKIITSIELEILFKLEQVRVERIPVFDDRAVASVTDDHDRLS